MITINNVRKLLILLGILAIILIRCILLIVKENQIIYISFLYLLCYFKLLNNNKLHDYILSLNFLEINVNFFF